MASPDSDQDTPGSSSLVSLSTPLWGTKSESKPTLTPGTTPLWFSKPHESLGLGTGEHRTGLPQYLGQHGDQGREKRRLAEIARFGLDKSPTKVAREGRSVADPLAAQSLSQGFEQPARGETSRPRMWTIAASCSPSALGDARPTQGQAVPQRSSPGEQHYGPTSYGLPSTSNSRDPPSAVPWTRTPLIPVSSFSVPTPRQFSPREPQLLLSSPTFNNSDTNPTMRFNNRFDKLECFDLQPGHSGHFNEPDNTAIKQERGIETMNRMAIRGREYEYSQQHTSRARPALIDTITAVTYPQLRGPMSSILAAPNPAATPSSALPHPETRSADLASQLNYLRLLPTPINPPSIPFNANNNNPQTQIHHRHQQVPHQVRHHQALHPTFYHPMTSRTTTHTAPRLLTQPETHALLLKGFSPNYRGDPNLARNQSAAIPADANCSLFLVGLAPDLTTHELLAGIRDVGRVYATHINPPDEGRGHVLSAAKVVFFERAAAERFHAFHHPTGFTTPSHPHLRARVAWNRIRSAEVDVGGHRSRVLLVSGPPEIANERFLRAYLDTKMLYQIDEVVQHGASDDGARVLVEFRFGSFRCQAEAARMALMREFREVGVVCEYGWDPCDRIQGLANVDGRY